MLARSCGSPLVVLPGEDGLGVRGFILKIGLVYLHNEIKLFFSFSLTISIAEVAGKKWMTNLVRVTHSLV